MPSISCKSLRCKLLLVGKSSVCQPERYTRRAHRLVGPRIVIVGIQPDAGRAAVLRQLPHVLVQTPVQTLLSVVRVHIYALYPPALAA